MGYRISNHAADRASDRFTFKCTPWQFIKKNLSNSTPVSFQYLRQLGVSLKLYDNIKHYKFMLNTDNGFLGVIRKKRAVATIIRVPEHRLRESQR